MYDRTHRFPVLVQMQETLLTWQPGASPASSGVGEIEGQDRDSFGWIARPAAFVNWQRSVSTSTLGRPRLIFRKFSLSPFTIFTIFTNFVKIVKIVKCTHQSYVFHLKLSGSINTQPTRARGTANDTQIVLTVFPNSSPFLRYTGSGNHDFHDLTIFTNFTNFTIFIRKS